MPTAWQVRQRADLWPERCPARWWVARIEDLVDKVAGKRNAAITERDSCVPLLSRS
jgi:hypothetical protein